MRNNPGPYGHTIRSLGDGCYRLSWYTDRTYSGSRIRHPSKHQRDTDLKGAQRFSKKHKITIPGD